jgi:NAD(P)-dependent dehydrogenase (short-subunit alcohol dehydrogenase family)
VRPIAEPIDTHPRLDLPHGASWVVTGGARGVTAAVAEALAKRYALKLHLIGTCPKPSDDAAWRNYDEAQMKELKGRIVAEAVAAGRSPDDDWELVKHDVEVFNTLKRMTDAGIKVYVGGGEGGTALEKYGKPDWVTYCFTAGGTVLNALGSEPVPYLVALKMAAEAMGPRPHELPR